MNLIGLNITTENVRTILTVNAVIKTHAHVTFKKFMLYLILSCFLFVNSIQFMNAYILTYNN
jgi:hypothetical protein